VVELANVLAEIPEELIIVEVVIDAPVVVVAPLVVIEPLIPLVPLPLIPLVPLPLIPLVPVVVIEQPGLPKAKQGPLLVHVLPPSIETVTVTSCGVVVFGAP